MLEDNYCRDIVSGIKRAESVQWRLAGHFSLVLFGKFQRKWLSEVVIQSTRIKSSSEAVWRVGRTYELKIRSFKSKKKIMSA
jgi:hypothetical protein